MKFFMENTKNENHRVKIQIPRIIINKNIVNEYLHIKKNTHINGFRKGKVPIKIIEEKYGKNIHYNVFNELMKKFFYKFINKEKINIIGFPKYFIHKDNKNSKEFFEYTVMYEKYPDIRIKNIHLLTAEKIKVNITDEDIKKNIEKYNFNNDNCIWNKVTRSIKYYDRVTINYNIYENAKKIKNIPSQNIQFIVYENNLLTELNNKIINRFTNDIVFLKIIFHSFHPQIELHNKNITCKIKILKVEEKQDNNAEKENRNHKISVLNFQTIKKKLIKQINLLTENHLKYQIIQKIIEKNPINIPPTLLKEEIEFLYKKNQNEYIKQKSNIFDKIYHVNLKKIAIRKIKIQLIISQIASDQKMSINQNHVKSLIHEISLNYKNPLEIVKIYNTNKKLKTTIENLDLEIQVIKFLMKQVRIVKKEWTFDQVMNYNWNQNEELFMNN